ncbi:MAG: hypothetical protein WA902_18820 [Thermosynechococcaceae cyanobacterium]
MRTSREKRLEALVAERDQINERIRQQREALARAERKVRQERAHIVGSVILDMIDEGQWSEQDLLEILDAKVAAKKHRELFDLPVESALTKQQPTPNVNDQDGPAIQAGFHQFEQRPAPPQRPKKTTVRHSHAEQPELHHQ